MFKGELVTISAILGLVVLEVFALLQGINGTILSLVMVVIAGLGGYNAKPLLERVGLSKTKK